MNITYSLMVFFGFYNYAEKYVIVPLKFVFLYPTEIILILYIILFGMEKSNDVKRQDMIRTKCILPVASCTMIPSQGASRR